MATPRPATIDEALLVERVRAGDPVAFEALFRLFRRELAGIAARSLGTNTGADDVVQDVFFTLWLGRERWFVTSSLRAYLVTATHRAAVRAAKRASQEATAPLETRLDPHPLPDALAEHRAMLADLDRSAAALSPRGRLVVELRRTEHLTNPEIAARLGLSIKTVEMHLTRAFASLRETMQGWR